MLDASRLECVRGDRRLFTDLTFSLRPGGLLRVHGPNGSGKTSLLRMLCGFLQPTRGEIRWRGSSIRSLGEEYFNAITYIGHLNGIKDELTAIENLRISSGLSGHDISEARAVEALEQVGLSGCEWLAVKVLSQGQRRRVAIARLLVCHSAVWILDEVLAALDSNAVALVRSLLEERLGSGGMVVMTTHQELNVAAASTQQILLGS